MLSENTLADKDCWSSGGGEGGGSFQCRMEVEQRARGGRVGAGVCVLSKKCATSKSEVAARGYA